MSLPLELLGPWAAGGALLLTALILLRRPLRRLWRLVIRALGGLAALAVFSQVGQLIGVTLGVNLVNALVVGVLGVPGFGLLLMLLWMFLAACGGRKNERGGRKIRPRFSLSGKWRLGAPLMCGSAGPGHRSCGAAGGPYGCPAGPGTPCKSP